MAKRMQGDFYLQPLFITILEYLKFDVLFFILENPYPLTLNISYSNRYNLRCYLVSVSSMMQNYCVLLRMSTYGNRTVLD